MPQFGKRVARAEDIRLRLEAEYRNLDRVVGWISNADNKALVTLSFQGAVIVGLATVASLTRAAMHTQQGPMHLWVIVSMVAFVTFFALSVLRAFQVIFPTVSVQRRKGGLGSVFFFEAIAAMPLDEFATRMQRLDTADIERELTTQTHINARIASRKFKRLKAAVTYLALEIVTLGASALLIFMGHS